MTAANLMIRNTNGPLPRIQAACCQRPDGRWTFVANNATVGSTEDLGNHLGSHYVAATIQITVNFAAISELAAKTMKWTAHKCNMAGTLSTVEVNQVNNLMRFTLAAGETIGLVSNEATSVGTFAAGTLTFAQAPTDADTFAPAALTEASTAGLGITGIRHNMPIGGDTSRCAAQWTAMQAAGLKLYLCLFDGGAGGAGMPYPGDDANAATAAAERTAWANSVVVTLLHLQANYPGLLAAAELWNEPDGSWPIPADRLALLAAELRAKMRAQTALNSIPLTAPATVAGEGAYWQTLVADGLLNHVDWVSHHMYSDPHVLERRIANLRAKIGAMPVFISEFGGNRDDRAFELAGSLTMLRALGIHGASHFTLKEYDSFPEQALLDADGTANAQGTAWKTWHQTVGGMAYAGKDTLPSNIQCHRFTLGGTTVRVAWASLGAPIINITGTYAAKDAYGAAITAGTSQTLGPSPIYLTSTGTLTVIYAPSQETLLAYPEMDFSLTQGLNGWTYQSLSGSTYTNAVADTINNQWTATGLWQLGPTTGHPGPGALAATRKWTVPVVTPAVARIRVDGTWSRAAGGDGSDVTLLHNAVTRFRRAVLLNATATIAQVFNAVAGDVLEFRVGPGPATDVSFDSTVLRALIYSAPTGTLTGVDIA